MRNFYSILISTLCLLGATATPALGQTNLQKWVEKCEKIESVDITQIKRKNPTTGKLEKDLTTITFKNNDALYQQLIEACKRDEEKAYEVINSRKEGKDIPQIYRFKDGDMECQYLFSFSKDGTVNVTIIVRNSKKGESASADVDDQGVLLGEEIGEMFANW